MKSLTISLLLLCFSSSFSFSKSKFGDYYLGFGLDFIEAGDTTTFEGEGLSLFANSLASNEADFHITLDYAKLDGTASEETIWNLGLDYIYHLDDFSGADGMFRPYLGIGIGYLDDSSGISLADDGFSWNLQAGTEILFTDEVSLALGAKFFGLLSDFSETDFDLGIDLIWWINDVHGVSLGYSHSLDREVDVIGLKYLYSWR
jgi:hypothetical protein